MTIKSGSSDRDVVGNMPNQAGLSRRVMLQRSALFAGAISAGGLLAACGSSGSSSSTAAGTSTTSGGGGGGTLKVTELSSIGGPSFANAPEYTGEKLYFGAEKVELDLQYANGTVATVQSIVSGKASLAWVDGFGVLVANSSGFPLTAFYQTFEGSPFGFVVSESSPITAFTASQVKGTTIGVLSLTDGAVPLLRGALARLNLQEGVDYTIKVVGEGPPQIADAIESGKVDIQAGSVRDFILEEEVGVPLRSITPEYINHFPGNCYATVPETLENEREALVRLCRGRAKATVFIRANPAAASKFAVAAAPESAEGLTTSSIVAFTTALWVDRNAQYFEKGSPTYHKIGYMDPKQWESYQQFLIEGGIEGEPGETLSKPVDIASVVDNSLIEEINDFDYAEVEAEAKKYRA